MSCMKVKLYKDMWCNGRKYHTKWLDDRKKACDNGKATIFHVTNYYHFIFCSQYTFRS